MVHLALRNSWLFPAAWLMARASLGRLHSKDVQGLFGCILGGTPDAQNPSEGQRFPRGLPAARRPPDAPLGVLGADGACATLAIRIPSRKGARTRPGLGAPWSHGRAAAPADCVAPGPDPAE
jgi:hypothetical protein